MKKIIILLIFIYVIPTVHADGFMGGKPGVVYGCVTDSETNEGINGVIVNIFNSSTSKSIATYTKSRSKCSSNTGIGTYDMEMPPGTYNVTFNKTGYITQTRDEVVLFSGGFNEQNANLVPETEISDNAGGISSGRTSSSESSTVDLTIFREEILTEDNLLDFMHKKGDAYGSKHAFNRGMGALASLYAAKGEKVTSTGMADTLSAAYPESETGMVRIEGGDIYQLAADYVMEHHSSPETLIIVRGDLAADSLVATPLSALLDAPILLVEPGRIPEPDFKVLDQRYERIYIIGGPAAVSRTVEQGLGNYSDTIIRIWGETRYETSVEVARVVRELGENNQAILTNGEKPVLYSASLSERYRAPILYLDAPLAMQSTETNPHQEAVSRYISEQALDIGMIYYNETLA